MPGPFTHIYEARRVADFLAAQGDFVRPADGAPPDRTLLANAGDAAAFAATMRKWPKFTSLGAIGPDLFFFLMDLHTVPGDKLMLAMRAGYLADSFNRELDELDATKHPSWEALAKVFRDEKQQQAANLIDAYATLMPVWRQFTKIWQELVGTWGALVSEDLDILTGQLFSAVAEAFATAAKAYLALQLQGVVAKTDFFGFFSLGMQKGVDEKAFFWSDMLHYRRTSEMAATLFHRAKTYAGPPEHPERGEQLMAYALGYACHVATDVAGHPFVNEQCGGPFRTHWQRHHMIENHIDAWNYRETKPGHSLPRDAFCGATEDYPELCQSALYFAVQLTEDEPDGELRRPLPPTDPNIVRAPGDAKGLTPLQRRLRQDALDTDGEMPEWLAAEIVHALYETYGADAKATPPLGPRNLQGFDFQTTFVEPAAHDNYESKYGLNKDTVPIGFPLPWEVQVSYKFMLSYFKRGFMDGFDLPMPRLPQKTAATSSDSTVTGAQLQTAAAATGQRLQQLIDTIHANKNRIQTDLALNDDTLLSQAETALHTAMNAFAGAVNAVSAVSGFLNTPVRLLFDQISVLTLPYRMSLFADVTLPSWNVLRGVRENLVQRGFLTPQDAEFLPDGTRLHDTEIDRRHVQLGYAGPPFVATVDTGYDTLFVASQGDGAGGWSGGWSSVGAPSIRGRRFTTARNGDGRLEAFLLGTDAVVYHTWQDKPNGSWRNWERLTQIFPVEAVDLAVTTNKDGRLEAFILGADYGIYHTWQLGDVLGLGSPWSQVWIRIGGAGDVGVDLAVGIGAGDRLAAFVIGTDGNVYVATQRGVNADFGGWSRIADPNKNLEKAKPVRLVSARNADGSLVLVVVDDHGGAHHARQQADASMGPWSLVGARVPGAISAARGAVACATDGQGLLSVAACGINGELYASRQTTRGGAFATTWSTLPGQMAVHNVALAANPDGTLECVAIAADSTIWARRFANGAWSAWQRLGAAWDRGKSVRLMPNADGKLQAFIDGVTADDVPPPTSGSRNTQGASYPFLPVDDEFRMPSAYPDRTLAGAPNAVESQPTVAGPFAHDTLAHMLLRTDGPADNDARRLYEQAQSPHDTDCLNEQFVGHGDSRRSFTNPLGSPVLFSAYLIGRLNALGGAPVANFNLDSDRAYGYLCWDWVRNPTVSAKGYNDLLFNVPNIAPSVQGDSKIVGGMDAVWTQAAQRWQAQGEKPLQLRYVPGSATPPPRANDPADDCVPRGSLAVHVEPAGVPLGTPVSVTVTAADDRSGHPLHGYVLVNGKRADSLGAAFPYTFAVTDTVVVTAYGYVDVTVAMPFYRLAIAVNPDPTPFAESVPLSIVAKDARTGAPVSATVMLANFDAQGKAADVQFPANVPYSVVLRASKRGALATSPHVHPLKVNGGNGGPGPADPPEPPSALVRAPGYADAEVAFTVRRPTPPKRMSVTVSPSQIPIGRPVSVTVTAVDAASGAAVAGTVLIGGAPAGNTGTPFSYTFGASAPEAHVSAAGYIDAALTWPAFYTPAMNVTFTPTPAVYNKPIQLVVHALDSHTGTPVSGTVTLVNYRFGGMANSQFPTDTPFGVTLRIHVTRPIKGNDGQALYPSITVTAPGYADGTVSLDGADGP